MEESGNIWSVVSNFNGIVETLNISGAAKGLLAGKTFVAKDLFDVAGYITGAGNPDWRRTHGAAEQHADVVQLLLDAGARLTGKSCTDELAFSLCGINVHYGTPNNSNLPGHIPGGSSSGSASAVAAGLCDFALGTDTAGSVRVPAAFCGIYGLRPTHGRIPTRGVVPLAPSFDTVGWFARSAGVLSDCAQVLLEERADAKIPSRILLVEEYINLLHENMREPFQTACSRLFPSATLDKITLPPNSLKSWSTIFATTRFFEIWQTHGAWLEQTKPVIADAIAKRLSTCANITAAEFQAASRERLEVVSWLSKTLATDVFCLPTTWDWPPVLSASQDELALHQKNNGIFNTMDSIGGLPQITIPYVMESGKSFGISLVAGPDRERVLVAMALAASTESPCHSA